MRVCPHCKRPMNSFPLEKINAIDELPLPKKQRDLVDALLASYPRYVSRTYLEVYLWEEQGLEIPETDVLLTHISKLKTKLKELGVTIRSSRTIGWKIADD